MMFYDDDWRIICSKYPLIAKKLEELRCETVNYEQYEKEKKELEERVDRLEMNGDAPEPEPRT